MSNLDQQTLDDIEYATGLAHDLSLVEKHSNADLTELIGNQFSHLTNSDFHIIRAADRLAQKVKELSEPKPQLLVTINVEGLIKFLLGWQPLGDDEASVIGDSRVAYLSKKDPGHVFMPAAMWHDSAYTTHSEQQQLGFTRANVDKIFLYRMLSIADDDYGDQCEAVTLYLLVRKFGKNHWEGEQ